jgi:S-adenosylmethionine:tRNA ribosyltransferase-isomerase
MVVNRSTHSLTHSQFDRIGEWLQPQDLLVVNSSRTLGAALPAVRDHGEKIQLRLCVRHANLWDVLAVQPAPPHQNIPLRTGERIHFDGSIAEVIGPRPDNPFLWRLRTDQQTLSPFLENGQPVRYSYVPNPVPLDHYQTVYAAHPGSAESPSAGRAFSWELLLWLKQRGVKVTDIVLHTGLSSYQDDAFDAEHHLHEEWFEVSADAARLVNHARRVVAVGTTVVRALESAAGTDGEVRPAQGWTELRVSRDSPPRAVDALLTGLHEPQASHFELLAAFLEDGLLERLHVEGIERRYLWHEFGDLTLIL